MTLFQAFGQFAGQAAVAPAGAPGMVLLKPTSISNSGGSATLGTNGQITFTSVLTLNVDGVFSANFDNYMISMNAKWDGGSGGIGAQLQLRAAGSNATGSDYAYQRLLSSAGAVSATRSTGGSSATIGALIYTAPNTLTTFIYGPYLSAPTTYRTIGQDSDGTIRVNDYAGTHSLSTSYDGFSLDLFFSTTGSTGVMQIYGIRS